MYYVSYLSTVHFTKLDDCIGYKRIITSSTKMEPSGVGLYSYRR